MDNKCIGMYGSLFGEVFGGVVWSYKKKKKDQA